jgi:hypothetical protein
MNITIGQSFNPHRLFRTINIPEPVFLCQELSMASKMIYGRLYRYAGEDGVCYPAVSTIAKEVGVADRQVQRSLLQLETLGFLRRCQRFDGTTNRQLSNGYQFLFHQVFAASFEADQHKAQTSMGEGVINVTGEGDKKDTGGVSKKTPKEKFLRESVRREYIQDSSVALEPSAANGASSKNPKTPQKQTQDLKPKRTDPPSNSRLAVLPSAPTDMAKRSWMAFRTEATKHDFNACDADWDKAEAVYYGYTPEDQLTAFRAMRKLKPLSDGMSKRNPGTWFEKKLWQREINPSDPFKAVAEITKPKRVQQMESADVIMKRDYEHLRKGLEAEAERLKAEGLHAATA